ncbi:hypothetical protein [Xanthobacter sp. YC-JY1]|uniref:hypothetical protein n=1 Tax=Xanthobacter sp. YC-JY1 TaxID=2419844 RepID=UPI001F3FD0E7|nr:hypothetical protein [Xanthobacter sp. YC-JY1]
MVLEDVAMDQALANAIKRRDELQRELAEIETFLRLHEKFSQGTNEKQVNPGSSGMPVNVGYNAQAPKPGTAKVVQEPATRMVRIRPRVNPQAFADAAERVLATRGVPLSRPQLVDELLKLGIKFPSLDPARYIGTILWRNKDRFVHIPQHGYFLKYLLTPEQERLISEYAGSDDEAQLDEGRSTERQVTFVGIEKK